MPAPLLDGLSFFGELQDARIAASGVVPIGNENVAIGSDCDGIRLVEGIGPIARNSRLTQRHQDFSIWAELEYLVAFAGCALPVRQPDAAVFLDPYTVRKDEHVRAEAVEQFACRVEFQYGRQIRTGAGVRAASFGDPHMAAGRDQHGA